MGASTIRFRTKMGMEQGTSIVRTVMPDPTRSSEIGVSRSDALVKGRLEMAVAVVGTIVIMIFR